MKDSAEYLQQAYNISHFHSWYCGNFNNAIYPELYSQRPPLYGLLIAACSVIGNVYFILFVQNILSLLSIYLCFRIFNIFPYDSFKKWLLLVPFIFFPTQFIYPQLIMSEILLQTAVMFSVYYILKYHLDKVFKYFILYIIGITALLLIKPVFVFYPLISFLFFAFSKYNRKTLLLLMHIIPLLTIIGITKYNYQKTGYAEFSSISRKLMINYNALNAAAYTIGKEKATNEVNSIQMIADKFPAYHQKASYIQKSANTMIVDNLKGFLLLTVKGTFLFFIDHSGYDLATFAGIQHRETGWMQQSGNGMKGIINYIHEVGLLFLLFLLLSIIVNVILACRFMRFIFDKTIDLTIKFFIATPVLYVAVLTGMSGTTRFRLPVFLLIVIACFLFKKPISKRSTRAGE
jgi:hypothetical protein